MFYEKLCLLCDEHNEKVTPLVKKLGYSSGSLTNWQKGTVPSGDIVAKFADYFNVSTDYLLGRTDDPTPPRRINTEEERLVAEILKMPPEKRKNLIQYAEFLKTQIDFSEELSEVLNSMERKPLTE